MGVPVAWYLDMDWSCDGAAGSAPGSGASTYNDPTCGSDTQKHLDSAVAAMTAQLVSQGIGRIVRWNDGRCTSTAGNPTGYSLALTVEEMDARLIHSLPVPFTNQRVDKFTSIPAPVKNATNLTNARNKITALGPAIQNEYNAALDPPNWARPGENGSPVGGVIVDWTMPDCTGYQVTDCEDTVETAALASNNPPPSFSSTTTATPDTAMMPGAVLSQSPAAGASGRPSSISFLSNPDPLNGFSGGGGAGGDDGSTITNDGDDECDFDDFATPPTWKDLYAENPKELF